jgi:hypothetical protein
MAEAPAARLRERRHVPNKCCPQEFSIALTRSRAIGRRIGPDTAAVELADVAQMLSDSRDHGRPWTPPWNPGAEFRPGEEPWKAEWWITIGTSEAPAGIPGNVTTIGFGNWDIDNVRAYHARAEEHRPGVTR